MSGTAVPDSVSQPGGAAAVRHDRDHGAAPVVSIIMPMLNEERHIGACLKSIFLQTFDMTRTEIFIVDGGSRDRSVEIVREFQARHPQIRLLENPHRYQSAALNIAIPLASGEYVLRMDCHSEYRSDYVEQAVRAFEKTGADNVVQSVLSRPGVETTEAHAIMLAQGSRIGGSASVSRREGVQGRFLTGQHERDSGWSFRRTMLQHAGAFDERLIRNQDNEYSCRIRRLGGTVWFEPELVMFYRARSTVREFLRLMYRNGFYHALTWRISPESMSFTHLLPAVFVLGLVVLAAAACWWMPAAVALTSVLCLYMLIILAECVLLSARHGWWYLPWLIWLFPALHLTYGVGTLLGIVRFAFQPLDRSERGRRVFTSPSTIATAPADSRRTP